MSAIDGGVTDSVNLLDRIRAAPDEEMAATLLVEAERERAALPDADPFRRPIELPLARIVVHKLRAGRLVYWS